MNIALKYITAYIFQRDLRSETKVYLFISFSLITSVSVYTFALSRNMRHKLFI